jgi:hypothetical protein
MSGVALSYFDDQHRLRVFRTESPRFTIGAAPVCDLVVDGLAPVACTIYRAEDGYFALETAGGLAVDRHEGSGYLHDGGTLKLGGWLNFRVAVDEAAPIAAAATPPPQRPAPRRPTPGSSRPARVPEGSIHRPGLALLFGLLAGGGQAYNGRPVKGALFLLTSVLVLPWFWSLVDAHREASRIVAGGGRTGRGGVLWVVFHVWFALNVALTTVVVLTITGVLS